MASDTGERARAVQLEVLRRLGVEGRLRLGAELSEDARRIAIEGVARRHPELTPEEARREVARAILGEPLGSRVFPAAR